MRISAGSMKGVGAVIRMVGRVVIGLALAITVAAILLGRYVDPLVGRAREPHGVVRAVHIQDAAAFCRDQANNFFDPETGESVRLALPMQGGFGPIGLAPPSDGTGSRRAAGFSAVGRGEGESSTHRLVVFGVPDGREIDRVSLDVIPTSDPCWSPDGSERIVFSAFDGRLYEYRRGTRSGMAVRRLEMRGGLTPRSIGQIRDVCWPTDPRLGGRLLVTTRLPGKADGGMGTPPYQMAWLRLDPEDGSILECEPLDRSIQGAGCERRFPTIGRSLGGGIQVAFLARRDGETHWHLELAELAASGVDGALSLVEGSERIIARRVHPTPAAFSSDGQFITYVPVVDPAVGPGAPIRMVVGGLSLTLVVSR
ncbi:hypothetical protein EP7_005094 [Isosphaeraceae bacterium EP7]